MGVSSPLVSLGNSPPAGTGCRSGESLERANMGKRQSGVRRVWTARVRRAIGLLRDGRKRFVRVDLTCTVEVFALPQTWKARRGPALVRITARGDHDGRIGQETRCARMADGLILHASRRAGSCFIEPNRWLSLRIPRPRGTGFSALIIRAKLHPKRRGAKAFRALPAASSPRAVSFPATGRNAAGSADLSQQNPHGETP